MGTRTRCHPNLPTKHFLDPLLHTTFPHIPPPRDGLPSSFSLQPYRCWAMLHTVKEATRPEINTPRPPQSGMNAESRSSKPSWNGRPRHAHTARWCADFIFRLADVMSTGTVPRRNRIAEPQGRANLKERVKELRTQNRISERSRVRVSVYTTSAAQTTITHPPFLLHHTLTKSQRRCCRQSLMSCAPTSGKTSSICFAPKPRRSITPCGRPQCACLISGLLLCCFPTRKAEIPAAPPSCPPPHG